MTISRVSHSIFEQLISFSPPPQLSTLNFSVADELQIYSEGLFESYILQNISYIIDLDILLKYLGYFYFSIVLLSLFLLIVIQTKNRENPQVSKAFLMFILFYLSNSIVCGTLADPMPRYNGRFVWIISWLMVLSIYMRYSNKHQASPT